MPDHLHLMLMGQHEESDLLATVHRFRLLSGKWMHRHSLPGWQRDFWDHVMRVGDDWRNHATYMALNPVRAGLVENYFDYPYLGAIGTELQDVVLRIDR
jgi:REP element-mobilizing transposase RayT